MQTHSFRKGELMAVSPLTLIFISWHRQQIPRPCLQVKGMTRMYWKWK
jgi:hypothetical protein